MNPFLTKLSNIFIIVQMTKNIKRITFEENDFPVLLKEIPDSPKELYCIGHLPHKNDIAIAIVGTRKVTPEGRIIAKTIAKSLAEKGVLVVSGLALGIDAAAHEGTLLGNGKTIAVLAGGLENIYPRQNYPLSEKILAKGGALVSAYSASRPYYDGQFLERNRIISGLCIATVVVEAPIRSGSLATARYAIEQGREVFVVPGGTGHPNYEGSHMLIRNGARLITSADEILEDLNLDLGRQETRLRQSSGLRPTKSPSADEVGGQAENSEQALDENKNAIINLIKNSNDSFTVDKISEATKLEPYVVNRELAFLVINGDVIENHGKFYINR